MARKSPRNRKTRKTPKNLKKTKITLEKGGLSPYRLKRHDGKSGYLAAGTRHDLLRKTHNKGKKWVTIGRSLNALYVFNKNKNPTLASKAKADSNWAFKQGKKTITRRRSRKKSSKPGTGTAAPFPFNLLNF